MKYLLDGLTLVDPFVSDLDSWASERFQELFSVDLEHLGCLLSLIGAIGFGLLFTRALLELHVTHVHVCRDQLVALHLLLGCELENVEGLVGQLMLFLKCYNHGEQLLRPPTLSLTPSMVTSAWETNQYSLTGLSRSKSLVRLGT